MPTEVGNLRKLEELVNIWWVGKFVALPCSIGQLLELKKLIVDAHGVSKLLENW